MSIVARVVFITWVAICSGSESADATAEVPENTCLLQHSAVISSGGSLLQEMDTGKPLPEESHLMITVEEWLRRLQKFRYGFTDDYVVAIGSTLMTDLTAKRNRTVKRKHAPERRDDADSTAIEIEFTNNETTGVGGNSSFQAPFVHVTVNATETSTNRTVVFDITFESPRAIFFIHLFAFTPLMSVWLTYFLLCRENIQWYSMLLPITLCCLVVAQHLVNQALVLASNSPSAVTAIQSAVMMVGAGIWSAVMDRAKIKEEGIWQYSAWIWVAWLFTMYQLVNHVFSLHCTLSERVVVNNLCPLVTIICESVFLPQVVKPSRSLSVKASLVLMVLGSVVFGWSSLDFTEESLCVSLITVLLVVIYRIVQRAYLSSGNLLSIAFLSFLDGLMCLLLTASVALCTHEDLFERFLFWLRIPSFMLLLCVSSITFTMQHICGLAMLRIGSATSYLVLQAIAGFIEVTLGILLFGDGALVNRFSCTGLGVALASGLWHSMEVVGQKDKGRD